MSSIVSPPSHLNIPSPSPRLTTNKKKDDDAQIILDNDESLTLRIKCNSPGVELTRQDSGMANYQVVTHSDASVHSLKESVRNAIGQSARGRYLRIIASGRLLAPDVAPLSNFKIRDGDCVHAVLAAAGIRGGQQAAMANGALPSSGSGRLARLGRGVGISPTGLILASNSSSSDTDDDIENSRERLGFDRLRSTGLTRDEIEAIRLYFSRQVDRYITEHRRLSAENEGTLDDPDSADASPAFRLRMEDAWMETQGPNSEFRLNLNTNNPLLHQTTPFFLSSSETDSLLSNVRTSDLVGTDRDFVWGFILGFFVGFIMLFWVWMPTVPHKQKLGILTGISFQLGLNLLRTMSTSDGVGKEEMV